MKVLVTGASGFIGGHTIDALIAAGAEVVAFDHHRKPREWPTGVEFFLGDVRDDVAVTEAMAHADAWIHLAAVLGTQETIFNPRPAAHSNLTGGLNVLEAAAQYDLPGVYICVGNHWMNNTYSITKTAVERFVGMFNAERGTRVNNVRCVNAYGPRQLAAAPFAVGKVRKITPAFVCRALSGMPVEIYGDGEQVSDMVYVEDVARVLVHALELAAVGDVKDFVIEAGPRESRTVNQVAESVIRHAQRHTHHAVDIVHLPMRPGEVPGATVSADVTTLARVGINPDDFVDLEDGLARTVDWFAQNEGVTWRRPEAA